MVWFWSFVLYSFLGFLLELAFARLTGSRPDRKCLVLLPLCPVYGLGAFAILLLPPVVRETPLVLFAASVLISSAVEYAVAVFYEQTMKVSFWDYRGLPWNLHGRVCLLFSLAWGVLALPMARWLHPLLAPQLAKIPAPVSWMAAFTLAADLLFSFVLLRRTGSRDCLRWYERPV